MKTNRDLYLAVTGLAERRNASDRGLEEYLRAILALFDPYRSRRSIELGEFFALIRSGFETIPTQFSDNWYRDYDSSDLEESTFSAVRALLRRQVVDLRELRASGALKNEFRDLGLTSPRGASWYNFEPASYLECACEGAVGGWDEADDTGRATVPGKVASVDSDGSSEPVDADDTEPQLIELHRLPWNVVYDFFFCGQVYE